ncbi:divergent polysaccharide deacetylase family protein [Campylobacter sp.]|uniref:divergent polysaccharide deacetylase family protein n=1 Tax=Campylobacter sp. TaxID=205 RepID=UPI0025C53D60|nr:divergent polysaccharide deacetylase family protein [Campylobacter sp.]
MLIFLNLYFQKKEQETTLQENNFSSENNLTLLQSDQDINANNIDLNFSLKNEKLDFLDKNISEILRLGIGNDEHQIDDQNLKKEQKSLNSLEFIQTIDDLQLDSNTTKQEILSDNILNDKKRKILTQIRQDKPSLAIIIDDMANYTHVKMLKNTKLKLIPSFFPPDERHPYTAELAKNFDFFMVHLPLAAISYDKAELNTLKPSDTKEKIFKRVAYIKEKFPNLVFMNNHTGSLFTSDENAMKNLFDAFNEYGFIFVDSRTIGNSKALKLVKEYNQPYIARDIFLDNEDNVEYIKKQIAQVVEKAKNKGFAIAIAHPRKNTFEALKQSKELLKSIQLVYLDEVYQ